MGHWTLRYGLIKNILVLFALIKDYKRHVVLFSIKNYIKKVCKSFWFIKYRINKNVSNKPIVIEFLTSQIDYLMKNQKPMITD